MSPIWSILLIALLYVNLSLVEAGKKMNQDEVIVINNNGGGKCGGHTRTIVKTAGQGKKGKGKKGKGHKIILSSGGGKCPGESKVTHIPFPMPVPHYEHVHHHSGWGHGSERREGQMAAGSMPVGSMTSGSSPVPSSDKGDRGMMMPFPFDAQRMDMPYPPHHMEMSGANPAVAYVPHPYAQQQAHHGHGPHHHHQGYGPMQHQYM
ncbi:protein pygopus [Tetranychus urticae]|uniref:Uncharacterized protein n=1 Tax=Tetranychus urticae TaxID=32264 RepID=T1KAC4_TETUR|nr:protein pygopus [Tetranychus urticae]